MATRYSSRVFEAWKALHTQVTAAAAGIAAHPTTGRTVDVEFGEEDPTWGDEKIIVRVDPQAADSELEYVQMSNPGRNEIIRLTVSIRSYVRGVSDPTDVVDRLEVIADEVQKVLHDPAQPNPYVSLGVTGELGLSTIDVVAPMLRPMEDQWVGECDIRLTVKCRV